MARMPGAIWKPLAANWASQPRMRAHNIICIHTMVGGLDGTDSLFRVNNGPGYDGTESHFGTGGDGTKVQWQDILFQADANYLGNPEVISIENADHGPEFPKWGGSDVPALTPAQVEANAQIVAWASSPAAHVDCPPSWACHREGIPLELIPDAKPGRRGIAPHRLGVPGYMVAGAVQWSTSRGKACPGDRRLAQIPQIIARARQIRGGATTTEEYADMKVIQAPGRGAALVGASYYRQLLTDEEFEQAKNLWGSPVVGNARQFDLWVSQAIGGMTAETDEIKVVRELARRPEADPAAIAAAIPVGLARAVAEELDRRARDGDPATGPVS